MLHPTLVFWIIGAPLAFAVIDLFRTLSAIRSSPSAERGVWSKALHVGSSQPSTLSAR